MSPFRLFIKDAGVLVANLRYLPLIFLPFRTTDRDAELYLSVANIRDLLLQLMITFLESIFLLAALPVFLLLPGTLSLLVAAICCVLLMGLTAPMQGARIAYSALDEATAENAKRHQHERWLFVNGIATG